MTSGRPASARDPLGAALAGLGQFLFACGLLVGGFAGYELYYTGIGTGSAQDALSDDLDRQWALPEPKGLPVPGSPSAVPSPAAVNAAPAAPAPAPKAAPVRRRPVEEGDPLLRLTIPSFGSDYRWVVTEGVRARDLKRGPGHYPGTQDPGEVGNTVLAGHRTTYGAPFGRLASLDPGELIVLTTRTTVFTYRTTGSKIVSPDDTGVLLPVPGRPGAEATERLLTLTTCHPRYSARQRLIVTATLVGSTPR